MSKTAMKLAMSWYDSGRAGPDEFEEMMRVLLAAPQPAQQQEPVAYGMWDTMLGKGNRMMMVRLDKGQDGCTVPLYTSPPAQRTWVGMTHEEHMEIMTGTMTTSSRMAAVEAKLKEKNT